MRTHPVEPRFFGLCRRLGVPVNMILITIKQKALTLNYYLLTLRSNIPIEALTTFRTSVKNCSTKVFFELCCYKNTIPMIYLHKPATMGRVTTIPFTFSEIDLHSTGVSIVKGANRVLTAPRILTTRWLIVPSSIIEQLSTYSAGWEAMKQVKRGFD